MGLRGMRIAPAALIQARKSLHTTALCPDLLQAQCFSCQTDTQQQHLDLRVQAPRYMLMQGAKYIDRLKYQETQPTHKKGFQTSDFSRRDEFSMTFRTEQYRTLLKQARAMGCMHIFSWAYPRACSRHLLSSCCYIAMHTCVASMPCKLSISI